MNYERQGFEKNGNELLGNVSQIIKSDNDYAIASTKLIEVAGISTFDDISIGGDETQLILNGIDKDGTVFNVQIDLTNGAGGTTFSLDGGITNYTVLNTDGNSTKADDMTYQQLLDVVSLATSGIPPEDPIATNTNSGAIATAIAATTPSQAQLDAATAGATSQNVKDYILEAIDFGILQAAAIDPIEIASLNAKKNEALRMADATHYSDLMQRAQYNVEVTLDYKGKIKVEDTKNSESKIEFSMYDNDADSMTAASSLNFMTNNAVTIEEPNLDFFKDLDQMIEAVRSGNYRIDSDNADPRNIGMQNSLARIDHVMDHVNKEHTKIGSYSNALSRANERSELLSINVQTVRSEIIDVDVGEAYMKFNQLANSYQATLSTVAKINSMTLLNYM
jgi:flagellar hook-associated protein 3 FlgL